MQPAPFILPRSITPEKHVDFCLNVINQYRKELVPLRREVSDVRKWQEYWRQRAQKAEEELKRTRKENEQLKKEIEKLTTTNKRYQVALFDQGNFKHPFATDKKRKGGQQGHPDTNRELYEDPRGYPHKRIFRKNCPGCGNKLTRANATRQKILRDIVLNPEMVKLIIESERQWCGRCHKEVAARDERSLPFTEYGINTVMMALLLRFRCLLPLSKIALVFSIGYGLTISESGLVSVFRQARVYLDSRYEDLKRIVRSGDVMYNDETGWQVRGTGAWMWIMANEQATVYSAAESRGKGIAKQLYGSSQAYSMHDGLASYTNSIPKDKQLYCWAHMLRFCYEETVEKPPNHESITMRNQLVELYQLKKDPHYHLNLKLLEREATRRINYLLRQKSKDPLTHLLQHRLKEQKEGLIRALVVTPNGTNNFAEQELRPIALARKISYGSDTFTGMETTAILASVVQTVVRTQRDTFFPSLASALRSGVANS